MKILLIAYDNESFVSLFPLSIAYVAAALRNAGHTVEIYNQDIHHYPSQHLTQHLDKNFYDVVGLGCCGGYWQYKKLIEISDAINKSKQRPFYILGGHIVAPDPQYFLRKTRANAAVIGEGEESVVELLKALESKSGLSEVDGIAYREDDKVVVNKRRKLIQDVDSIVRPAYDLFDINYYRLERAPNATNTDFVMPMLSGRGCPYTCGFCARLDKGFRKRSNESIIDEMLFLKKNYGITYISFNDELLMSSEARTMSFCEALIKAKVEMSWWCNGRLNFATVETLKAMKAAGCCFINYGIESLDDEILADMSKHLTVEQITKGIENTLAVGLTPGLNFMFGWRGETKEILDKGVDFLMKYDVGTAQLRTIRPMTPYPGSPIFNWAVENGMIKDAEGFYENLHVNSDLMTCNFSALSDDEFYDALYSANKRLLNNYHDKKKKEIEGMLTKLYKEKNSDFRGFREV